MASSPQQTMQKAQKRRRKASSCVSCRKLKTRCDFEPLAGKCHRCNVLRIECSLTGDRKAQIEDSIREAEQDDQEGDDDRLERIESQLSLVLEKLENGGPVGRTVRRGSDSRYLENIGKVKSNHLDNSTLNSPLNVIARIDGKLFGRVDRYQPFVRMCEHTFTRGFYAKHKSLCLKLGTNFLNIAHFWIVPGGIKEIDDEYVKKHPFIAAVFVLLAMGFDENYSYVSEQEELYWTVRKMLSMALSTSPLTDHDVEAILYCSLYNIARKPAQPLLDGWMISGDGIKQMMLCANFQQIEDRAKSRNFTADDLFYLRIWTLLCVCHLQSAIGNGRPQLIPVDYIEICQYVVDYPLSNLEDNVNFALVRLTKQVHAMFYTKDLILNLIRFEQVEEIQGLKCFRFEELSQWRQHWKELIANDLSGTLLFNYDFYHVILSRRFISSYKDVVDFKVVKYMEIAYNTAMYHSRAILDRFLKLPKSLVKGSPNFLLNQVVYSCLTLYDFQGKFENKFNIKSLNLVSRVYWHLNLVGETKNDATDTVGQIIKTLVDVRAVNSEAEIPDMSNDGEFEHDYKPLHDEISHEYTSDIRTTAETEQFSGLSLNVDKFETFEDFFRGIAGL